MGEKKSVLYVEDQVETAAVRWLEQAGYTVTVAVDGDGALEKVATERYDCILLDIAINQPGVRMPKEIPFWKVGLHILRCLRDPGNTEFTMNRCTPVIVVSGIVDMLDTREIQNDLKPKAYLVKPFHPKELVQKVREVLGEEA